MCIAVQYGTWSIIKFMFKLNFLVDDVSFAGASQSSKVSDCFKASTCLRTWEMKYGKGAVQIGWHKTCWCFSIKPSQWWFKGRSQTTHLRTRVEKYLKDAVHIVVKQMSYLVGASQLKQDNDCSKAGHTRLSLRTREVKYHKEVASTRYSSSS